MGLVEPIQPIVGNKKNNKKHIDKKNKGGRPTKYKPEYCQKLLEFFDKPRFKRILVKKGVKSKGTKDEYQLVANELPTFERFAHEIGVHYDTLREWVKVHPEFSEAWKRAKAIQKDFLIQNGLLGLYNSTFAIFTAKNITDMKDKVEMEGSVEHRVVTILPPITDKQEAIEAEYEELLLENGDGNKDNRMETKESQSDSLPSKSGV